MRPSTASALVTLASTASAMSSSSSRPFLMLSTHKSSTPLSVPQYAADASVLDSVKPYLSSCPTAQYLIVNQADLHSSEIYDADSIPNLRRHAADARWADRLEVGEVHDSVIDGDDLAEQIRKSCPDAIVDTQYLHSLGADAGRGEVLADNDLTLSETLTSLASESLTLIYYSGPINPVLESPNAQAQYVATFPDDGAHMELKRDFSSSSSPDYLSARQDDDDEEENWPEPPDTSDWTWFQRNRWLTGPQTIIITTLLIMALLLVWAMMTVTSIVIPYGAFDGDYVQQSTRLEKKRQG